MTAFDRVDSSDNFNLMGFHRFCKTERKDRRQREKMDCWHSVGSATFL